MSPPDKRFNGFVPGRHLIDAYGAGGFRFGEMGHRGSILALPSGVRKWDVAAMAELTPDSLALVLAEAESIGHLIIGTGHDIAFLPGVIGELLRAV